MKKLIYPSARHLGSTLAIENVARPITPHASRAPTSLSARVMDGNILVTVNVAPVTMLIAKRVPTSRSARVMDGNILATEIVAKQARSNSGSRATVTSMVCMVVKHSIAAAREASTLAMANVAGNVINGNGDHWQVQWQW